MCILAAEEQESYNINVLPQKFLINGAFVQTNILNINGCNYLKLSEFAKLLDIDIQYSKDANKVNIDKSYKFFVVGNVPLSGFLPVSFASIYKDFDLNITEYENIVAYLNNHNAYFVSETLENNDYTVLRLDAREREYGSNYDHVIYAAAKKTGGYLLIQNFFLYYPDQALIAQLSDDGILEIIYKNFQDGIGMLAGGDLRTYNFDARNVSKTPDSLNAENTEIKATRQGFIINGNYNIEYASEMLNVNGFNYVKMDSFAKILDIKQGGYFDIISFDKTKPYS
jgi:hypothetical protein